MRSKCEQLKWSQAILDKFADRGGASTFNREIGCKFDESGSESPDGQRRCYYPYQASNESTSKDLEVKDLEEIVPTSRSRIVSSVLDELIDAN